MSGSLFSCKIFVGQWFMCRFAAPEKQERMGEIGKQVRDKKPGVKKAGKISQLCYIVSLDGCSAVNTSANQLLGGQCYARCQPAFA
jgi:hypothetical protein